MQRIFLITAFSLFSNLAFAACPNLSGDYGDLKIEQNKCSTITIIDTVSEFKNAPTRFMFSNQKLKIGDQTKFQAGSSAPSTTLKNITYVRFIGDHLVITYGPFGKLSESATDGILDDALDVAAFYKKGDKLLVEQYGVTSLRRTYNAKTRVHKNKLIIQYSKGSTKLLHNQSLPLNWPAIFGSLVK
ncbi:hypothetical protein [Bdellovibrio bacteriovorus]|uniref:hypothetical protein n=1 Tax=Bdellovibrio TaxID=958 RepID=UPI0035A892DE